MSVELEAVIGSVSVAAALVDTEGRFLYVNERMAAITAVPLQEHLGRTLREVVPEFADQLDRDIGRVLEAGEPLLKAEYHARTREDPEKIRSFTLDFHPIKEEPESYAGVLIQARDVTKRREAKVESEERARLLELLFEYTLSPLALLDRDFNFVRVNRAYARADDKTPDDFVGRNHFDMYPSDAIDKFREAVATKQAVQVYANPFQYAENPERGVTFWDWHLVPVLDASGEVELLLFSLTDVTDRINAEIERGHAIERVMSNQKFESLAVMAGGIARDLNNMMQIVVGYSDLALQTANLDGAARSMVERINSAAVKASELGNQMLAYARKSTPPMAAIQMHEVVAAAKDRAENVLGACELSIQLPDELVLVYGEATALQNVLVYLVQNAAQSMAKAPGTVEVTAGYDTVSRSMLGEMVIDGGLGEGRRPFVEVRDSGIGIPPQVLSRIFDPFFSTKPNGRGFGLAAVDRIVQMHSGAISVKSKVGHGTVVRVYLNHAEERPSKLVDGESMEDQGWRGDGTVLIVEDEADVTGFEAAFLEKYGFDTLTATGMDSALELFRRNRKTIVAVLLDYSLGTTDGKQVAQALKAIDPSLPVLLCSGFSEDEIAAKAGEIDVEGFIPKPFSGKQLRDAMRTLLES
ncbi:MAG: PAS domain-containing protein [Gemmatimonadota bacterium]|nr:PAS domain-containing protein [Gemmatimonadota bacterium]